MEWPVVYKRLRSQIGFLRGFVSDLTCLARVSLFAAAFLLVTAPIATAEQRIALVIGNGAYTNQPLSNPPNDAALIAETLRGVGFEVDEVINADGRSIKRAVHSFSKALSQAGEDAVGFVYYAGHGIQADGENYMIPVDAKIEDAIDVRFEGFPASTLLSALNNAGNRLNIVVMDACRNNPYKAATRSGGTGLARMDAPAGTLIAYSTAPGKVAADGRGRNSPYTRALARSIQTPGARVEDVFKTVRVAVMERTNDAQVPWESSSLTGDFFFLQDKPAPAAAAAAPEPAQQAPDHTVELTFWNTIKDSQDAGLFEAYLQQYPSGLFVTLAQAKIAAIRKKGQTAQSQTDTAFFQAIQNSTNKADFEAYLEQYPNGVFASLARARIDAIENKAEEQVASRNTAASVQSKDPDTAFWDEVKSATTAAEMQAYLNRFPDGKYADIANARIAGLEEQRQLAALSTGAATGHPMDGKWKLEMESISRGAWINGDFCKKGDRAEKIITVEEGRFNVRVSSSFGSLADVRGTFSETGAVSGYFRGHNHSAGAKRYTLETTNGTGNAIATGCSKIVFTLTRQSP
jgi:uncharacterized caspase-like protein